MDNMYEVRVVSCKDHEFTLRAKAGQLSGVTKICRETVRQAIMRVNNNLRSPSLISLYTLIVSNLQLKIFSMCNKYTRIDK